MSIAHPIRHLRALCFTGRDASKVTKTERAALNTDVRYNCALEDIEDSVYRIGKSKLKSRADPRPTMIY